MHTMGNSAEQTIAVHPMVSGEAVTPEHVVSVAEHRRRPGEVRGVVCRGFHVVYLFIIWP